MSPSDGDRSRNNMYPNNSSLATEPRNVPPTNDVYVGHIPNDVDSHVLREFFSQFGEIDRIFEGRRHPSGGMKWAFISYIHTEDAFKYTFRIYVTHI